jgi:hypothetical protein
MVWSLINAKCCNCGHIVKDIYKEYNTYWNFQLTCDECGWEGYWDIIEDDGFIHKGMSKEQTELEMKKLITPKRVPKCKCGGQLVENDGHFICNEYLEDIKKGIQQQQDVINELNENEIL